MSEEDCLSKSVRLTIRERLAANVSSVAVSDPSTESIRTGVPPAFVSREVVLAEAVRIARASNCIMSAARAVTKARLGD